MYEMLRLADIEKPCLHNIYEWWDSMIEKVKEAIYKKEHKSFTENTTTKIKIYDASFHDAE